MAIHSCILASGLILRCAGKVGNPFETKQWNRPSCGDQEGRSGSDDVLLGTSVFPSSETGMLGKFWGRKKIKSDTVSIASPPICHEVMGPGVSLIKCVWGQAGGGREVTAAGARAGQRPRA